MGQLTGLQPVLMPGHGWDCAFLDSDSILDDKRWVWHLNIAAKESQLCWWPGESCWLLHDKDLLLFTCIPFHTHTIASSLIPKTSSFVASDNDHWKIPFQNSHMPDEGTWSRFWACKASIQCSWITFQISRLSLIILTIMLFASILYSDILSTAIVAKSTVTSVANGSYSNLVELLIWSLLQHKLFSTAHLKL